MDIIAVLYVCIGISWAGCGQWQRIPYPSFEKCYESLAAMRFSHEAPVESGVRRTSMAFCRPKIEGEEFVLK